MTPVTGRRPGGGGERREDVKSHKGKSLSMCALNQH